MDFRLPDIWKFQTTRHLWTPGYQTSGNFRLPDIYGLQATRHPEISDYQTSMDSRLPDIRKHQTTRHLWTPGYQTSGHLFSSSFFLLSTGLILISLFDFLAIHFLEMFPHNICKSN